MQEEVRVLTFPAVAMLCHNRMPTYKVSKSAEFLSEFRPITKDPACVALWAVSKHFLIVPPLVHFLPPIFFFFFFYRGEDDLV